MNRAPDSVSDTAEDASTAPIRLPAHVTLSTVSAACRDAWRVFIEQSDEWRKAEQVLWSGALYAPIRHYAGAGPAFEDDGCDDYETVDARFLERMIQTARVKALDVLASFAIPRARLAFGVRMRDEGVVTQCEDSLGSKGYLPTLGDLSLSDRILALIAADLLNRPEDFEGETLCSACGGIVVGPEPCCQRYEGRETCVPSRRCDTVVLPQRKAG